MTGRVTDAQGRAIPNAKISLVGRNENLSAHTDTKGNFSLLLAGTGPYSGSAEADRYNTSRFGPFTINKNETKTINVVVHSAKSSLASSAGVPDFYDQPQFTIAGVTDSSNLGGHASGMTAPTESLTKEVQSLAENTPTAAPNADLEEAACALADNPSPPGDRFKENHAAGTLLLADGKPQKAIRYLLRASQIRPNDYDNSFALARAYTAAGDYSNARTLIQALLAEHKSAELHHLLAVVEEKSGDPVAAEKDYRRAAKLDPSEANVFDWGMELLTHRAPEPASEVFSSGNRHFPRSSRMLIGLGAALYERGSYEEALLRVCAATDLDPNDPNPYLLLGKMLSVDTAQSDAPLTRLDRFSRLQPDNAWANYYYAVALWKRRKGPDDASTSALVESLLNKAVHSDPKLANPYFQLGVLYSEEKKLPQAISSYENAVQLNPKFVEAHYRLAQAYAASGQTEKSQQEIAAYKQNSKLKADQMESERREVRQFVYTMQSRAASEQVR